MNTTQKSSIYIWDFSYIEQLRIKCTFFVPVHLFYSGLKLHSKAQPYLNKEPREGSQHRQGIGSLRSWTPHIDWTAPWSPEPHTWALLRLQNCPINQSTGAGRTVSSSTLTRLHLIEGALEQRSLSPYPGPTSVASGKHLAPLTHDAANRGAVQGGSFQVEGASGKILKRHLDAGGRSTGTCASQRSARSATTATPMAQFFPGESFAGQHEPAR